MQINKFEHPHSESSLKSRASMLELMGVKSEDDLVAKVLPANVRLRKKKVLPWEAIPEFEFTSHLKEMASRNKLFRSFIGLGYYQSFMPQVLRRNVFENPAWYADSNLKLSELKQGKLEALHNLQTAVSSLTGFPSSCCTLQDEATATAEAMIMMFNLRSAQAIKRGCNVLFVDENIFPQIFDMLLTRSEGLGIEIVTDNFRDYEFSGREFGAVLQYPNSRGEVVDYSEFARSAHSFNVKVAAVCDLMSLCLLRPPAAWGADLAVGNTQRLGLPLGYGGSNAAFISTKKEFESYIPSATIICAKDRLGSVAFCVGEDKDASIVMRQHINFQALMPIISSFYCVYHGAEGLKNLAFDIYSKTATIAMALKALECNLLTDSVFDTLEVEIDVAVVSQAALERGFNFYYPDEQSVRLTLDQSTTNEQVISIIEIFSEAMGKSLPKKVKVVDELLLGEELIRRDDILIEPIFSEHNNEQSLLSYIKSLENRNLTYVNSSVSVGARSLGFCTEQSLVALGMSEFADLHPFSPPDQVEGFNEIIENLSSDLATLMGMDACSLQATSPQMSEYTALMIIRAYYQSKSQSYKNVALLPQNASELSILSARQAGMRIALVATNDTGAIHLEALRESIKENGGDICCLMLCTHCANTLFNSSLRDIIDDVHDAGAQVYMCAEGLNSLLGITNPGYLGIDICGLNYSYSSAPAYLESGVGAVCAASHLGEFLPTHSIVECGGENGMTAVSATPFGNALLHLMAYSHIRTKGEQTLRKISQEAILNANYLCCLLSETCDILACTAKGKILSTLVLDFRALAQDSRIEPSDLARRLSDYGICTSNLNYNSCDALVFQLSDKLSKQTLDRFAEAIIQLGQEIKQCAEGKNNIILNAPYTQKETISGDWTHNYTAKQAIFPLEWIKNNKFFAYVSRIVR